MAYRIPHFVLLALISAHLISCSGATTTGALSTNAPQAQAAKPVTTPPKQAKFKKDTVLGTTPIKATLNTPLVDTELGSTISDFEFEVGVDSDGDGAENETAEGRVELTGFGSHEVELVQEDYPVMSNEEDMVVVTDKTTGAVHTFFADQELFNYKISNGQDTLEIETLPDGTWLIDGASAATPEEVIELAFRSPVMTDMSLHGLVVMYEFITEAEQLEEDLQPEETLVPCNTGNNGNTWNTNALAGDPSPLLKAAIQHLKKARSDAND